MTSSIVPTSPLGRASIRATMLPAVASILVFSLLPTESQGAPGSNEEVITVATRPRITQAVVVVRPPGKPLAAVVVLVGGAGKLDLTPRGVPRDAPGLLVKRRNQLAGHGFVVAFPGAPSDRFGEGLLGFRSSREHSIDVGAIITRLRHQDRVPVRLVGVSMGRVSAAWDSGHLAEH